MKISALGMTWYTRENYDRVKAISDDPESFPDTFNAWHQAAKAGFDRFTAAGHTVVKAHIDPDTFPHWCRVNGHKVDSDGRKAFANAAAHEAARKMHAQ